MRVTQVAAVTGSRPEVNEGDIIVHDDDDDLRRIVNPMPGNIVCLKS